MCECHVIENNTLVEPVSMVSEKMRFSFFDKTGKRHVLIDKFNMDFLAKNIAVTEEFDGTGNKIAYVFRIT
jgi:hypothetical protein